MHYSLTLQEAGVQPARLHPLTAPIAFLGLPYLMTARWRHLPKARRSTNTASPDPAAQRLHSPPPMIIDQGQAPTSCAARSTPAATPGLGRRAAMDPMDAGAARDDGGSARSSRRCGATLPLSSAARRALPGQATHTCGAALDPGRYRLRRPCSRGDSAARPQSADSASHPRRRQAGPIPPAPRWCSGSAPASPRAPRGEELCALHVQPAGKVPVWPSGRFRR
jgi:hypothetical protein